MAPDSRIYLMRHAQGFHNVDQDWFIPDPRLTELGKKQATSAAQVTRVLQNEIELVVTSPLCRTLQTTLRTWASAVERLGMERVICLPQAQECLDFPCDIGSSREDLEIDPEFAGSDFSRLTPDWNSKTGFWAPDSRSIANRAKWVRHFLRDRPEKTIVLVAHGDFLRQITCSKRGPSTYMWDEVEIQAFRFDDATVDQDDCFLVQDKRGESVPRSKA